MAERLVDIVMQLCCMLRRGVFQYPPGSNPIMHAPASQAESLIRATGARLTRARTRVLAALLAAERALTHHEVEKRLMQNRRRENCKKG